MTEDVLGLMKTRRSIRRFKQKDVPDELLEKIMEAGRWAPSGDNGQAWRFIVVRDPVTKEALGKIVMLPTREDITMPIQEHLIVELYSK